MSEEQSEEEKMRKYANFLAQELRKLNNETEKKETVKRDSEEESESCACPSCGGKLYSEVDYCPYCGCNLEWT